MTSRSEEAISNLALKMDSFQAQLNELETSQERFRIANNGIHQSPHNMNRMAYGTSSNLATPEVAVKTGTCHTARRTIKTSMLQPEQTTQRNLSRVTRETRSTFQNGLVVRTKSIAVETTSAWINFWTSMMLYHATSAYVTLRSDSTSTICSEAKPYGFITPMQQLVQQITIRLSIL